MNDDNVKAQTLTDKETAAQEEFSAISDDDDVMWRHRLSMNKRGDIENTIQNLTIILQNDPKLKGIVFNELSDCIEIKEMCRGSIRLNIGAMRMTRSF